MIKYDRYDVTIVEQLKDYFSDIEEMKEVINREDIYLEEIPEEYADSDKLMKIVYITLSSENYASNKTLNDSLGIQIDYWKRGNKVPLSEGNRISGVMEDLGFYQIGSFDGNEELDFGKYRDSRRYVKSFSK